MNLGKKSHHKARVVGGEVAEDLFERGLCLPSGTAMTVADIERVISVLIDCHKKA
jgi:dTDP-4-amino-4,6-dideoxygalactose transaminase